MTSVACSSGPFLWLNVKFSEYWRLSPRFWTPLTTIYAWAESRDYGKFSVKIQGLLTKKEKEKKSMWPKCLSGWSQTFVCWIKVCDASSVFRNLNQCFYGWTKGQCLILGDKKMYCMLKGNNLCVGYLGNEDS